MFVGAYCYLTPFKRWECEKTPQRHNQPGHISRCGGHWPKPKHERTKKTACWSLSPIWKYHLPCTIMSCIKTNHNSTFLQTLSKLFLQVFRKSL